MCPFNKYFQQTFSAHTPVCMYVCMCATYFLVFVCGCKFALCKHLTTLIPEPLAESTNFWVNCSKFVSQLCWWQ